MVGLRNDKSSAFESSIDMEQYQSTESFAFDTHGMIEPLISHSEAFVGSSSSYSIKREYANAM